MKKASYSCGLDAVLDVLGGKWKFLIIRNLATGPKRFGELRRLVVGVSEKVLIEDLKELVQDGIALRRDFQEVPPKVEYQLTELGSSLAEACRPLCEWGVEHMDYLLSLGGSGRVTQVELAKSTAE